jgi:hypothetical protein
MEHQRLYGASTDSVESSITRLHTSGVGHTIPQADGERHMQIPKKRAHWSSIRLQHTGTYTVSALCKELDAR